MQSDDSKERPIRVWMSLNSEEVKKHLLLVDDLYGSCGNCKQLGLNYTKDQSCPGCKTEFKYLITRVKDKGEIRKILARIEKDNLGLKMLEREDWERADAKDALSDLFS